MARPRHRTRGRGGGGAAPSTFSPFGIQDWIAQNQNTEAYTVCQDWPSPAVAQPPTSGGLPLFPASLPVLVLGGELDTWTPPVDAPKVLAEIGGHARATVQDTSARLRRFCSRLFCRSRSASGPVHGSTEPVTKLAQHARGP